MEGLINALFGEIDEETMALDFLNNLSKDEQETILKKAASHLPQLHGQSSSSS